MPYTMEDFKHDVALEHLSELTIDERLEGLPIEKVLQGISAEEILQSLPIDVRLKGISAEEIEAHIEQRKADKSNPDVK